MILSIQSFFFFCAEMTGVSFWLSCHCIKSTPPYLSQTDLGKEFKKSKCQKGYFKKCRGWKASLVVERCPHFSDACCLDWRTLASFLMASLCCLCYWTSTNLHLLFSSHRYFGTEQCKLTFALRPQGPYLLSSRHPSLSLPVPLSLTCQPRTPTSVLLSRRCLLFISLSAALVDICFVLVCRRTSLGPISEKDFSYYVQFIFSEVCFLTNLL